MSFRMVVCCMAAARAVLLYSFDTCNTGKAPRRAGVLTFHSQSACAFGRELSECSKAPRPVFGMPLVLQSSLAA